MEQDRESILALIDQRGIGTPEHRERFAEIDRRAVLDLIEQRESRDLGMGNRVRNLAAGVVDTGAAMVQGAWLVGAGMSDTLRVMEPGRIPSDAVSALTPGAMQRRRPDDSMRGVTRTAASITGDGPRPELPPQETPAEWRDREVPWRNQSTMAQQAAQVAERMQRWSENAIGAERSTGPVAGFFDDLFRSAPMTIGGVAVGAATGAVTRNPGAGLTAGAVFMGMADASSEMEETYRRALDKGVPEEEAVRRANIVGAVYAPASIMLERVGLGKLLKIGENVPGKNRLMQAVKRVAEAGAAEGVTEVMQTATAEAIRGGVEGDFGEFKRVFAASDEPLRAFLMGAVMGGGIRTGGEVINPANYRTAKAFMADVDAAKGEAESPETAGPNAGAAAAINARLGGVQARQTDAPSTAQPGQAAEQVQPDAATAEQADPVADGVARFLRANEAEGRTLADAELNDTQRAAAVRLAERGIRVAFVDAGKPLRMVAANPAPGVVVMDARLEGERAVQTVQWHEAVHDLERRSPGVWQGLVDDLEALAPEVMEAARSRYAARWQDATGDAITPDRLAQEGPSNAAELVIDAIMAEQDSPGTLGRLLTAAPPSVRDRLVSVIQAMLRAVGLHDGATRLESIRADLRRRDAMGGEQGVRAAVLIREAVGQLRPFVGMDAVSQNRDATVQNPRSEPVAGGSVSPGVAAERPARAVVRDRRGREYSKSAVDRRLRQIIEASPRTQQELESEWVDGGDQHGMEFTTSFSGPLPTEIRDALSGEPPSVRTWFRANVPGGMGDDVLGAIGAEAMVERVKMRAQGQDARIEQLMDEPEALAALAPEAEMLATVRGLRGGLRADEFVPYEVVDNPAALPEGATFAIQDTEFVVVKGEEGTRAVSMDDPGRSFNLDQVESMPVDRRSLNRNAGAVPAEVDPLEGLPFAVRDDGLPYANVPDSLMGFRRNGPNRGFDEQGYPFVQAVRVTFSDGRSFTDEIKGMNRDHAMERARRNWEGATIEAVGEPATIDPDIRFAIRDDQPDLPGAQPASERIVPEGRPDLANPGRTDEVRGFVSAVDQIRNAAGQPEPTTFDAIEARADAMLARDPKGVEARVRDRVARGEALTAEETVILSRAVNRQTQGALRTENAAELTEAVRTAWQYRQSGTIAARALGVRRDRVAGPGQRYREAMMNAILLPSPKVRAKLDRIAQQLADPDLADSARAKLEEQQGSLFDREGKKIKTIREDLAKQGIDPRLITEDTMADPTFAATVTDIARRARTDMADALYSVWMNNILSGPLTHVANLVGNFTNLAWRYGALRGIEAGIGTSTGGRVGETTLAEYGYMMGKTWASAAAGWQAMVQSWSSNRQVFDEQITGEKMALFDNIKGESVMLERSGPRSRVVRALGLNGVPLKLLAVEDQFFKAFAGNLHAHSLAYRQAKREGLEGDAVAERVEALLEDWSNPIWRESLEEARAAVFQDEPSVLGEAAMDLRRRIPGMKYLIPFIRTPDRLFVRGIEASPVGALMGVADAYRGLRSGDGNRVARGAATAMLSFGLLATIAALRDDEDGTPRITGSRTPNWRDSDEQYRTAPPQSIRIGGKWYSYARIEPLSTGLAMAVDMLDRMEDGDNLFEGAAGSWKTLLAVAEDKTFLRSIGEVLEAVREPERSGGLISNLARRTFVTAWVPNLFKQTTRAFDPSIRDTRPAGDAGWWDAQAARLPYEALPVSSWGETPRYDLWGRPIERGSPWGSHGLLAGLYRLSVPINVSDAEWHPVDRLVFNYNRKVRDGQLGDTAGEDGHDAATGEFHPRPPGRSFVERGEKIELTAEEYQSMIREAGQRASERLLSMDLDIEDPGRPEVRRIRRVFREEYDREKRRIARERRGQF